jgi:CubicO group peptidase (beta-lactamase class C family)
MHQRNLKIRLVAAMFCLMPRVAGAVQESRAPASRVDPEPEAESAPATLANWYWGPNNRWSWHNMRRLFPTARVGRGDGPAVALGAAPKELGTISFLDPVSGQNMTVAQMLDATDTDGFIVLRHGKVVYETYRNGMTPDDPHLLMSMTKSVTGALAGVLVEKKQLDPQKLITDYVPEVAGTIYDGATVRQLLDMVVADPSRTPEVRAADFNGIDTAAGWLPPPTGGTPGLRAWLQTLSRPKGQDGQAFLYLTQTTTLVAWAMERATKTDFSRLLTDAIWSKLGAEQDAYILLDGHQQAYASPGLNVTLRDMARFGLMIEHNGRFNGQQIVPEDWIRDIRRGGDPDVMARGKGSLSMFEQPLPGHERESYRSFWWVTGPQCGRISANGLGGQLLIIDPEADMVAVKFTSATDPKRGGTDTVTAAYGINAIIASLSGHGCE